MKGLFLRLPSSRERPRYGLCGVVYSTICTWLLSSYNVGMDKPHNIRVKRVVYERPDTNPFAGFGIRELGRLTGWDFSYLSKVKRGEVAISEAKFQELCRIAEKHRRNEMKRRGVA